ncbi:MAG: hypothetical protein IJ491_01825 [Clostridia bacterium]|nr:hypothetical protein [Clostridia bacterium]
MLKKHKKLFIALTVIALLIASALAVAFSHELFTTLPQDLSLFSHMENAPMLVAHRGLSSLYPENSIPAFEGADEYGFDGYELDIHTTKDGEWVVIHDDTVDKMTDGTGDVESFTLEEINKLVIDSGNGIEKYENLKVPVFTQALDTCADSDIIPFIEIKKCDVRYLPELKNILDEYGLSEKAVLISFEKEYLEKYRELDKNIEIMLLKGTPDEADVDWCIKYNAGLDFGYYSLHKVTDVLKKARENGVRLGAWTVDNTAYMDVMVLFGVEVITTNKILP